MDPKIYNSFNNILKLSIGEQKQIGYAFYKDYGFIKTLNSDIFLKSLLWYSNHISRLSKFSCNDASKQAIGYFGLLVSIFELIHDEEAGYIKLDSYELTLQKWLYELGVTFCYPIDPFVFITVHELDSYISSNFSACKDSDKNHRFLVNDYRFDSFIESKLSDLKISLELDVTESSQIKKFKSHYNIFFNEFINKFTSIEFFNDLNLFDKKDCIRVFHKRNHPMLQTTIAMRIEIENDDVRKIAADAFLLLICSCTSGNENLRDEVLDFLNIWMQKNNI